MSNWIAHFDLHADDLDRAMNFYGAVFGWKFTPWGPADFFLISPAEGEGMPHGALVKRQVELTGSGLRGAELTIAVEDLAVIEKAVTDHGGTISMNRFTIPTVGTMFKFVDPEGNHMVAMQYEARMP